MAYENGPLIAIAMLKNVEPLIGLNKRAQLDRTGVRTASDLIGSVLSKLHAAGINELHILSYLSSAKDCLDAVLEDNTFVTTDQTLKEIVMDKVSSALGLLYVPIGRYYMNHEFNFTDKMRPILNEVIDHCVASGEYFGYDKVIKEAR